MTLVVQSATFVRPYPGLSSSGDAALCLQGPEEGSGIYLVVDALGHGPDAAQSADRVTEVLRAAPPPSLWELFVVCDQALRGLREVVMSAIRFSGPEGTAWFAGIGNVEVIGGATARRPAATPGRVGRGLRSFREWPLHVEAGHRWVLASDGVRSRDLRRAFDAVVGLDAAEAAQQIVNAAGREDDDASALVLDFAEARL
jgi:phosphoserine phosphatase RsbX